MKSSEYKELKRKAEDRCQNAIEMAQKQRIQELNAIETVWKMSRPSRRNKQNIEYGEGQQYSSNTTSYGAIARAVKDALKYVPETFTKSDIKAAIEQISPDLATTCKDSSLTGRLIRLVNDGVIEQTRAGKGCNPSEYRKKPDKKQANAAEKNIEDYFN